MLEAMIFSFIVSNAGNTSSNPTQSRASITRGVTLCGCKQLSHRHCYVVARGSGWLLRWLLRCSGWFLSGCFEVLTGWQVVVSAVFLSAMSLLRMFFRAVLGCCHDVLDGFLYVVIWYLGHSYWLLLRLLAHCNVVSKALLSGCYGVLVDC